MPAWDSMKLKDLQPNEQNPRIISKQKLAMLKKAVFKFGDLGGVIYNRKSQRLVGGHQRQKVFDPASIITIVKKYSRPTKTGTVAEGFIEVNGERFSYREVYWTPAIEKAANIAANKGAGEWDIPQLNEWLKELSHFDVNIDLDLTMFDAKELSELPTPIEVAAHTRKTGSGKDDEEDERGPAKCKAGELYALGKTKLKVGEDDLHYCDLIISRWEKYSGNEAVLIAETKVNKSSKTAKQPNSSHA